MESWAVDKRVVRMGRARLVGQEAPAAPDKFRESWDNEKTAAQVRSVLDQFEDVPTIDRRVMHTLQRWLYRQDKYCGGGGAGRGSGMRGERT